MNDMGHDILASGTNVGSYRIERLLGRGGAGTVYLAYDTTLHRRVALKMITAPAEGETSRARLQREARNAAALNHPNICTVYEVGDANDFAFRPRRRPTRQAQRQVADSVAQADHFHRLTSV